MEFKQKMFSFVDRPFHHFLSSEKLNTCHSFEEKLTHVFKELNLSVDVHRKDIEIIPRTGPVMVVSNLPFGSLEAAVIASQMLTLRKDIKVLANQPLARLPLWSDLFVHVEPGNPRGLKEAMEWVLDGKLLVVFPATLPGRAGFFGRDVVDPEWDVMWARMVRRVQATVVPVYLKGKQKPLYQLLGRVHTGLRTALLPRELMQQRNQTIRIEIGTPLSPQKMNSLGHESHVLTYLRQRTFMLSKRDQLPQEQNFSMKPIVAETDRQSLEVDIKALQSETLLLSSGAFDVYCAKADVLPNIIREIGRLREVTFRSVGEGTGKSLDLDSYDRIYDQLFVWNREKKEIVGAYRLALSREIISKHGIQGLYISTLFHLDQSFFKALPPAIELGRSFVRVEYQRTFSPLMLLWKGIGEVLNRNTEYTHLFGLVSISNAYTRLSRELMGTYLMQSESIPHLAQKVWAYNPLRVKSSRGCDPKQLACYLESADELSTTVSEIEPDRKGIPVLLKQYLKLGGKIIGMNVDRSFNDSLDGFIVVDLQQTDPRVLEMYLGKGGPARLKRLN